MKSTKPFTAECWPGREGKGSVIFLRPPPPRPPLAVNWRSTFCSPLPYTLLARTNPPSVPPENHVISPKFSGPPSLPPHTPINNDRSLTHLLARCTQYLLQIKSVKKISFVFFLIPFQTLPEVLAGGQISLMDICYRRYNDISVFITLYNTESDKVIRRQF